MKSLQLARKLLFVSIIRFNLGAEIGTVAERKSLGGD